jgi:GntR family transcriptional regulator
MHAAQPDRLTASTNGTRTTSTMERVKVDFAEGTPLYQQVAAEIRRAIAEGEARPGERMPLAKDLATVLGVNTNTVLRALRQLRDEGMLEFRRGRGITVAGTPQRGVVMARVKDLVAFARQQGYQPAEVIAMIESVS